MKYGMRLCAYCKKSFEATTKTHRYCSKSHANADARGALFMPEPVKAVEPKKPVERPTIADYRLPGGMTDDEREAFRAQTAENVRRGRSTVHAFTTGRSWLL